MEEQQFIQYFMSILTQIKLYHWATMSYAKHKALDHLHSALSEKIDLLIESYIGRYKKQPLKKFTIESSANTQTEHIEKYLDEIHSEITAMNGKFKKSIEIQNILQDILAEIDRAQYLCRLS